MEAAKGYPPPNFLIMIGNRYGWVPLPYAIARDEFEALTQWLKGNRQKKAARHLEKTYRRDDNYLVARGLSSAGTHGNPLMSAYTLRSREDEAPELRPAEVWAKLEALLRCALQKAADALLKDGKLSAAAHEKYFLSLTEQEIKLGLPSDADGNNATASNSPSPSAIGSRAIAFIREIVGYPPPNSRYAEDKQDAEVRKERVKRLDALKERIKRALSDGDVMTASAIWEEGDRLDEGYGKSFAGQVLTRLKAAVDQHIAAVEAMESKADFALKRERIEHYKFREEKLKVFVGRESNLKAIRAYIAGSADYPLVLHGRSGLGKSALMAKATAETEVPNGPPVIFRFIGASAESSDVRSLLISLVEDLKQLGVIAQKSEFEKNDNKLADQVRGLLSSLTNPVIIFLDALDQLRNPGRLPWFPHKLPRGVKLVVSALHDKAYEKDSKIFERLQQRLPKDALLEIEPLRREEGRQILQKLESDGHRRLRDEQRDYIVRQFETANASPLWLRTAFEIAKSWKSTDQAGEGTMCLSPKRPCLSPSSSTTSQPFITTRGSWSPAHLVISRPPRTASVSKS